MIVISHNEPNILYRRINASNEKDEQSLWFRFNEIGQEFKIEKEKNMIREFHYIQTPFEIRSNQNLLRGDLYRNPSITGPLTPLILSHGFMSNSQDDQYYAAALASAGYLVITYDFPGGCTKGRSTGRTQDMTILTEKQDLRNVMNYVQSLPNVNADKLILMGCSQGGFVSGLAAAEYPHEVDQLILMYPALCIPDDARSGKMLGFDFDPLDIPDVMKSQWGMLISGNLPREMQTIDAIDTISGYPGKVLLLYGVQDPIVKSSYMTTLIQALKQKRETSGKPDPSVQVMGLEFAEHGFRGTEAPLVVDRILAFLNGMEEILAVNVTLTDVYEERRAEEHILHLGFDACVENKWFTGRTWEDYEDRQRRTPEGQIIELKADYYLKGTDYTGEPCTLHVTNLDQGDGWKPTLETENAALSFVNGNSGITLVENRPQGPVIHILMKI